MEKKSSLEYLVIDDPKISVKATTPEKIQYSNPFTIKLTLEKDSFTTPEDIMVSVNGLGIENIWEISELKQKEELILEMDGGRISKSNSFQIKTIWKDKEGKSYSDKQEIIIVGEANNLFEKVKMLLNKIINIFI